MSGGSFLKTSESFSASIFVTCVVFLFNTSLAFVTSILTKSLMSFGGVLTVCFVYPLLPRPILLLSFFSN